MPENTSIECKFTSEITVKLIQKMGGDEHIIAAARVSTSGEQALEYAKPELAKDNAGLINYLMKNHHGSPYECGAMTFYVHAPIFCVREWMRHRIGHSFSEESGRYKKLEPVFWIPRPNRKMVPSPTHKSARPDFVEPSEELHTATVAALKQTYQDCYTQYLSLLSADISKEVARSILPVGIYSSFWVTVNPRSLMHFLSLRTYDKKAKHLSFPMAEIEEGAKACEAMFKKGWPLTHAAWHANGRVAP